VFIQVLKTLVKAGQPLPQGLRQWGAHLAPRESREYFLGVSDALERGRSMGPALDESRFPISPTSRRILAHLEVSPEPARLLESLESGHLGSTRINELIRESLIYPAGILMAFIGTLILLTYTFYEASMGLASAFGNPGSKPVLFALITAAHPLRFLLWGLFPAAAFGVLWLWLHPQRIPLPIVREMLLASQRALFCQFLQLEISAGRPLGEILGTAQDMFDRRYRPDLSEAAAQTSAGSPLQVPVRGLLPAPVQHILNQSGSGTAAAAILSKMQDYYARELRIRSAKVRWIVETSAIAVMGVLVGFLVTQVFQTLYGYFIGTLIR
jgi:type II secretory pathway component PulF